MDLNPQFTGSTSFRRSGENTGELDLFKQVGIPLVHGWLVDPHSPEAIAVAKAQDYDSAVNLVVEVDHITKGNFVVHEDDPFVGGGSGSGNGSAGPNGVGTDYTSEEKAKIEDGTYPTS